MKLQGRLLATGIARRLAGFPVIYELIIPATTSSNLQILNVEASRWANTLTNFEVLRLDPSLIKRARFGGEVFETIKEWVKIGACCVLIAQADSGEIIGLATYGIAHQVGYLHLQVIDPSHLAGSPGVSQLRGIGTAMVAAISSEMLKNAVTSVYLHPLDSAAERFWGSRGFTPCGGGGRMCVSTVAQIKSLVTVCIARPDDACRGDLICLGEPSQIRAYRIPSFY